MPEIQFKLDYTIRDTSLARPDQEIALRYTTPRAVDILLRAPSPEEQARGHLPTHMFCIATCRNAPKASIAAVFNQIADNRAPKPTPGEAWTKYPCQGIEVCLPSLASFPQPFQDYMREIEGALSDMAKRTVHVLRWRTCSIGLHDPISTRGLHWSLDGQFWHPAPADLQVRIELKRPLRPSRQECCDTQVIVESGSDAPLHYNLFLEAWQERHTNRRSSLLIGVAAAELAIKHCIAVLVPNAEWLAMHVPMPPLTTLVSEYLPTLPARNRIDQKVKPPPKSVQELLRKGVSIRNLVAHAGKSDLRGETVEEILIAVRDFLYLVDYYCGAVWASQHLSSETATALGLERADTDG